MVKKRLVAGYLTLVGLPLVAVLLILKLGEGIQPPPAIDGAWLMEATEPMAGGDCAGFLGGFAGRTLTVSQSGRFLSASWDHQPQTTMRGTLEGNEFTLSSAGEPQGGCEQGPLRIDGLVLEAGGKHALDARLSAPACDGCGELKLSSPSQSGRSATGSARGILR